MMKCMYKHNFHGLSPSEEVLDTKKRIDPIVSHILRVKSKGKYLQNIEEF